MKDTETAIAEKVLPKLIGKMLPDFKDVTELTNVIISNICSYGYQSKKIITDARLQVFSGFMPIAENFFANLNDTISMSIQLDDQRYDKIIDFIIQNENASFERKIELYQQLDERKHRHKMNYVKGAVGIIGTVATAILVNKSIDTVKTLNTNKSYNKRKSKEAKYKYRWLFLN